MPPIAAMREGVQIPPRPLPTRRALMIRFALYVVVIVALRILVGGGVALVVLVVVARTLACGWRLGCGAGASARRATTG